MYTISTVHNPDRQNQIQKVGLRLVNLENQDYISPELYFMKEVPGLMIGLNLTATIVPPEL